LKPPITTDVSVDDHIAQIIAHGDMLLRKFLMPVPKREQVKKTRKYPKFVRLSVLHDLLYYQVRGYTGDTTSPQQELFSRLKQSNRGIDEQVQNAIPPLFLDYVSCYMFLPPLPAVHGS